MPTKSTAHAHPPCWIVLLGTPVTGVREMILSARPVYATWVWAPPLQPHPVLPLHTATQTITCTALSQRPPAPGETGEPRQLEAAQ